MMVAAKLCNSSSTSSLANRATKLFVEASQLCIYIEETHAKAHLGIFPCATNSDFLVLLPMTAFRSDLRWATSIIYANQAAVGACDSVHRIRRQSQLRDGSQEGQCR
jgi:hypothetical protein